MGVGQKNDNFMSFGWDKNSLIKHYLLPGT